MKHTRHNESPTKVKLTVTLDRADLATSKQTTLTRLSQQIKVPGFRPGKVPTTVAEKHLNPNTLAGEIASDAMNRYLTEVFAAEAMQPITQPEVTIASYVPDDVLEFSAVLEIVPAVKLGNYKALKAARPAITVSEQDIHAILERMRQGAATKTTVDREAKLGDEVIIDFTGTQNGQPVAGAAGNDYPLTLGSHAFIPGFEDGLVGKKAGDSFTLPLTFPADYHASALAGANIDFAVTVKKIHEATMPALDDAFATTTGPFKTLDDLKADIRRELTTQKEREATDGYKQALLDQLVATSDIPAPETLVQDQMNSQERDFTQNLLYRGTNLDEYLATQKYTKEEWREKDLREKAVHTVQIGLALAELRNLEKVTLESSELDERWNALLSMYGKDAKTRQELDTPQMRRDFANRLATEKVIDRLLELNPAV